MTLSSDEPTRRSGRRPGPTRTRDAIVEAARQEFGELGYDRATIRGIASVAGVDAALVLRFHGSKEALFRAAVELPAAAAEAIVGLADGPRETVGRRLAELIVGLLETPRTRAIVLARVRSAASQPDAAALLRETVTRDVGRLAAALTDDEPEARAVLVGTTVVGIAFARYIVQVEPLASWPAEQVVDYVAPTFQHYLVEPLRPAAR